MRLIGELGNEQQARTLAAYLGSEGIAAQIEPNREGWMVWVVEEDRVEEAAAIYREFLERPEALHFSEALAREERHRVVERGAQEEEQAPPRKRRLGPPMGKVTLILMAICALLVVWGELAAPKMGERPLGDPLFDAPLLLTPPYSALLFDYPKPWGILQELSKSYTLDQLENSSDLTPAARLQIESAQQMPIFRGLYYWVVQKITSDSPISMGPMFVKIGEGQVWRLFTPALLHGGLLHLFINLLWMIILGNQVEHRLGIWHYLLFLLLTGIVSNVAQYLMSGPAFLGLSGVVVALFGFVWMRTVRAPWEGYTLSRPTIIFVNLFLFGMVALQLVSFGLQIAGRSPLPLGIANTAHLTGLAAGIIFGRLNIFSYRVS